jgi:hypothetical protein
MDVKQKAVDTTKCIISRETLLAYPNFNKLFINDDDKSHTQLGAIILEIINQLLSRTKVKPRLNTINNHRT